MSLPEELGWEAYGSRGALSPHGTSAHMVGSGVCAFERNYTMVTLTHIPWSWVLCEAPRVVGGIDWFQATASLREAVAQVEQLFDAAEVASAAVRRAW